MELLDLRLNRGKLLYAHSPKMYAPTIMINEVIFIEIFVLYIVKFHYLPDMTKEYIDLGSNTLRTGGLNIQYKKK